MELVASRMLGVTVVRAVDVVAEESALDDAAKDLATDARGDLRGAVCMRMTCVTTGCMVFKNRELGFFALSAIGGTSKTAAATRTSMPCPSARTDRWSPFDQPLHAVQVRLCGRNEPAAQHPGRR
jgi:hypothetical protein